MNCRLLVAAGPRHNKFISWTIACLIVAATGCLVPRAHGAERASKFTLLPPQAAALDATESLPPAFLPGSDPRPPAETKALSTAMDAARPLPFGAPPNNARPTSAIEAGLSSGLEPVVSRLPPIDAAEQTGPLMELAPPDVAISESVRLPSRVAENFSNDFAGTPRIDVAADDDTTESVAEPAAVEPAPTLQLPKVAMGGFLPTPQPPSLEEMRTNAWWTDYTSRNMRSAMGTRQVSINSLISDALRFSAQVQVLSDTPLIRETAILESDAAFDWSTFLDTTWYDTNEPVGSTLTTGGPPRFENQLFEYEYGVRKQTVHGGRLEVGQRYGHERSNSVFFIPNDQGTARLTLSYNQPLLRGSGRVYNTGLVVLAQVESGVARNEFSRELQAHLLEVARGYWALYLERGALVQKQRLFERGTDILNELEHRQAIDAVANQIVRARAAVAARQSDLYRSAAAVKNAEGRIRALVNAPQLGALDEFELMPVDAPMVEEIPVEMAGALETSFRHRPEIHSAIKQIKAAAVRKDMSKNELLPVLDVVLESYLAGLRGESSIGGAWNEMFTKGSPSYSAGLHVEVPLRNREARARFRRRALELRQFQNQLRATLHAMQLEVEIAVREVQASFRELMAKYQAMRAADSEVDYIDRRWRLLPGEDRTASLVLEDLLGAQERLTAKEFEFLNSQVTYNLALTNLKRATGTLLQVENVSAHEIEECGIPKTELFKSDATVLAPADSGAWVQPAHHVAPQ